MEGGFQALYSNTTGTRNTANGALSLYSNETGLDNTANGYGALHGNLSGSSNTASGHRALFSNAGGQSNTAGGSGALDSNTEGDLNTAFGVEALLSNTTGSRNTAIGNSALRNSTGGANIALGDRAGQNLTTGSENIAIGNSGVAGESSTIRIGNSSDHDRTFVAGIRGVTTGISDALPVVIDSTGQLGTLDSGLARAALLADGTVGTTPTIDRSFTNLPGGSAPVITRTGPLGSSGIYRIDFGVDVSQRYFVATLTNGAGTSIEGDVIRVTYTPTFPTSVIVTTLDHTGAARDSAFYLTVY